MDNTTPHIVILSEQSVRAKSLSDLIHSATGNRNTIVTLEPRELRTFRNNHTKPIFFLDLMGCHQPSQQIIKTLKDDQSDAKIIALHMYRNRSLIAPILNEGVDGYLYYEPSRAELAEALKSVQSGKKYEPTYTDS